MVEVVRNNNSDATATQEVAESNNENVDTASSQQQATEENKVVNSNARRFACGKCRKVLFTENELQDHSSEVK